MYTCSVLHQTLATYGLHYQLSQEQRVLSSRWQLLYDTTATTLYAAAAAAAAVIHQLECSLLHAKFETSCWRPAIFVLDTENADLLLLAAAHPGEATACPLSCSGCSYSCQASCFAMNSAQNIIAPSLRSRTGGGYASIGSSSSSCSNSGGKNAAMALLLLLA